VRDAQCAHLISTRRRRSVGRLWASCSCHGCSAWVQTGRRREPRLGLGALRDASASWHTVDVWARRALEFALRQQHRDYPDEQLNGLIDSLVEVFWGDSDRLPVIDEDVSYWVRFSQAVAARIAVLDEITADPEGTIQAATWRSIRLASELDAEAHSAGVAMLEDLQTLRAVTDDVAAEMRVATRLLARGGGRSPGDHAFDREASALRGPGVSWSYVRARKQLLWTAGRFLVGAKPWTNCYFCCQVGIE
jgi:hypothetical protein